MAPARIHGSRERDGAGRVDWVIECCAAGAGIGVVFGIVISWSGMASPEVIRHALLVVTAFVLIALCAAAADLFAGRHPAKAEQC